MANCSGPTGRMTSKSIRLLAFHFYPLAQRRTLTRRAWRGRALAILPRWRRVSVDRSKPVAIFPSPGRTPCGGPAARENGPSLTPTRPPYRCRLPPCPFSVPISRLPAVITRRSRRPSSAAASACSFLRRTTINGGPRRFRTMRRPVSEGRWPNWGSSIRCRTIRISSIWRRRMRSCGKNQWRPSSSNSSGPSGWGFPTSSPIPVHLLAPAKRPGWRRSFAGWTKPINRQPA